MREIQSVALIGLGAIGGYVAPKLYETLGQDFKVVAQGERKKRLEKGVNINEEIWKFPVVEPQKATNPVDLFIFSVKFHGLKAAMEDAKALIGPDTIIMSLLNGVESEDVIRKGYPDQHILYSVIRIPSVHENGKITYPKGWGQISFGNATNEQPDEDVLAVKDLFEQSGIGYQIPEDMLLNMWNKFMTNVSENQVSAILKAPYGIFQVSEDADYIREEVAKEVIKIANAKGVGLEEEILIEYRKKVESYPFHGKTSTAQDIIAGRKTEVEDRKSVV